jgi:hypothetical protein
MTEAKLAPNLPQWMKDHVDRYLSSGGTDGHMLIKSPNLPEMAVPSLLLTTTGRKSVKNICSRCSMDALAMLLRDRLQRWCAGTPRLAQPGRQSTGRRPG